MDDGCDLAPRLLLVAAHANLQWYEEYICIYDRRAHKDMECPISQSVHQVPQAGYVLPLLAPIDWRLSFAAANRGGEMARQRHHDPTHI